MTHATIDQLTDHLRGQAGKEAGAPVEAHLASGCERCNRLLAVLSRIRRVGRTDAAHRPPSGVVRTVKALAGFRRTSRRSRLVDMRLSFDSLLSPAGGGSRSLHTSSRHLVFYSQEYALDLRMDSERSGRGVVVIGQLLNRDWGPLPDVPAYLVSGDRVVSRSRTGLLGEFQMECRPEGAMHLRLAITDHELIDVELDRRRPADLPPIPQDRAEPSSLPASLHSRMSDASH